MKQIISNIKVVSAIGVLALGLTASVSGAGATAAGASGSSPIRIGVVGTTTGPLASSEGPVVPVTKAWADWTNAHGGIDGHHIDLFEYNDNADPSTSLTDVEKLVTQDQVSIIVSGTDNDSAFASYVAEHKIPVVSDLLDSNNSYFFNAGSSLTPASSYGAFYLGKQAGGKKAGFLYCTETSVCSQINSNMSSILQAVGNVKLAYSGAISVGEPSYTSICLAAQASGADMMLSIITGAVQIQVFKACQKAGYHPIQLSSDVNFTNAWLQTSSVSDGTISSTPVFPFTEDSTPATKAFHQALAKYEPGTLKNPTFGEIDAVAWTSAALVGEAATLGKVGSGSQAASSAAFLKGLFAMHDETLGGLAPKLTFTHQANEDTNIKCFFSMKIAGGKFVVTNGGNPTCPSKI